jgi:hypothetical protein
MISSFYLSMISGQTLRVCPEGKPLPTFPDHALNYSRGVFVSKREISASAINAWMEVIEPQLADNPPELDEYHPVEQTQPPERIARDHRLGPS